MLLLSAVTLSINTREPVPHAAKHAHVITLPLSCLVSFGLWAAHNVVVWLAVVCTLLQTHLCLHSWRHLLIIDFGNDMPTYLQNSWPVSMLWEVILNSETSLIVFCGLPGPCWAHQCTLPFQESTKLLIWPLLKCFANSLMDLFSFFQPNNTLPIRHLLGLHIDSTSHTKTIKHRRSTPVL